MFDQSRVKENFDRVATSYDLSSHMQKEVIDYAISILRANCDINSSEDSLILDAGCGTGHFQRKALLEYLNWKIIQLDLSYNMCKQATSLQSYMHIDSMVVNGTFEEMPFTEKIFDGVFSSLSLQWSNEPEKTLQNFRHILKDDGWIMISTLGQRTLKELRQTFIELDGDPHVMDFISMSELYGMARRAGFRVIKGRSFLKSELYGNPVALMQQLKSVGGTNSITGRKNHLTGKDKIRKAVNIYRRDYVYKDCIYATWEIYFLLLKKTSSASDKYKNLDNKDNSKVA